ncbi:carboxymuconolactone decarboxylase family protein [Streptosporangium sp. NPDC006013]|uniref:carboxymuconolactone decarboxylase family protein n=1 Tax=Streptosporangium sp. NPDC006013 TaxID=3155596 RepID=UPI0033B0099F
MTNAPEIFRPSRVDFAVSAPRAFKALISFDAAARDGLDPALVELVQIRASQLNGCAYCGSVRELRLWLKVRMLLVIFDVILGSGRPVVGRVAGTG